MRFIFFFFLLNICSAEFLDFQHKTWKEHKNTQVEKKGITFIAGDIEDFQIKGDYSSDYIKGKLYTYLSLADVLKKRDSAIIKAYAKSEPQSLLKKILENPDKTKARKDLIIWEKAVFSYNLEPLFLAHFLFQDKELSLQFFEKQRNFAYDSATYCELASIVKDLFTDEPSSHELLRKAEFSNRYRGQDYYALIEAWLKNHGDSKRANFYLKKFSARAVSPEDFALLAKIHWKLLGNPKQAKKYLSLSLKWAFKASDITLSAELMKRLGQEKELSSLINKLKNSKQRNTKQYLTLYDLKNKFLGTPDPDLLKAAQAKAKTCSDWLTLSNYFEDKTQSDFISNALVRNFESSDCLDLADYYFTKGDFDKAVQYARQAENRLSHNDIFSYEEGLPKLTTFISLSLKDKERTRRLMKRVEIVAQNSSTFFDLVRDMRRLCPDTKDETRILKRVLHPYKTRSGHVSGAQAYIELTGNEDKLNEILADAEVELKNPEQDYYKQDKADLYLVCFKRYVNIFGEEKRAQYFFQKIKSSNLNNRMGLDLGILYLEEMNDKEKALKQYQGNFTNSSFIQYRLRYMARLLTKNLADMESAQPILKKALKSSSDSHILRYLLMWYMDEFNDIENARHCLDKAISNSRDSYEYYWLANTVSDYFSDEKQLRSLLVKGKNKLKDASGFLSFAELYIKLLSDKEEAHLLLKKSHSNWPFLSEGAAILKYFLYYHQDEKSAKSLYKEVLSKKGIRGSGEVNDLFLKAHLLNAHLNDEKAARKLIADYFSKPRSTYAYYHAIDFFKLELYDDKSAMKYRDQAVQFADGDFSYLAKIHYEFYDDKKAALLCVEKHVLKEANTQTALSAAKFWHKHFHEHKQVRFLLEQAFKYAKNLSDKKLIVRSFNEGDFSVRLQSEMNEVLERIRKK